MEFSNKYYLCFDREEFTTEEQPIVFYGRRGHQDVMPVLVRTFVGRHITPLEEFDDLEQASETADLCEDYAKECLKYLYKEDTYDPRRKTYFRVYKGEDLIEWANQENDRKITVHELVNLDFLPLNANS